MSSDIRLDGGPHGEQDGWVSVDALVLNIAGSDLILDAPSRRVGGGDFRRALVHNQSDGLSINFAGDYPGGVSIEKASLNLKVTKQDAPGDHRLPASARIGDMVLLRRKFDAEGQVPFDDLSLWLCVGERLGVARWQQLSMGPTVNGTV